LRPSPAKTIANDSILTSTGYHREHALLPPPTWPRKPCAPAHVSCSSCTAQIAGLAVGNLGTCLQLTTLLPVLSVSASVSILLPKHSAQTHRLCCLGLHR
jgi:hypothetical protein